MAERVVHVLQWARRARRVVLRRARKALDHRVDELQVAWVVRQRERHLRQIALAHRFARAQVILHVAGPAVVDARRAFGWRHLFVRRGVELGEDRGVGLAQDVRQHVEPPAMRHADQHLARPDLGGVVDELVEHRHEHVGPLDGEALLPDECAVQEMLERLDLGQPPQQVAPLRRCRVAAERRRIRRSRAARCAPA